MEFLRSFLRRHFAGKPVVTLWNVVYFLRQRSDTVRRPRFARLAASPLTCACTPLTKSEEKERLLAVYGTTNVSNIQLVVYYHAALWLVELLLGYMLYPTSSEKRRLWKPKQWQLNSVLLAKVVLSRYFWASSWILLKLLQPHGLLTHSPFGLEE